MSNRPIRVMQLIDSLDIGGAERMAVNIANALPPDRVESYLCVTRRLGPLEREIAPHVKLTFLARRRRLDFHSFYKLVRYLQSHKIDIIHAHSSSVFIATFMKMTVPSVKVVWHDHNGNHFIGSKNPYPYKLISFGIDQVIVVNQAIHSWATQAVGFSYEKTHLIHNFVTDPPQKATDKLGTAFGTPSNRVVFVANLRHPKDHVTLIQAMALVTQTVQAHLLFVGAEPDTTYAKKVREEVSKYSLQQYVHFLGQRSDVYEILHSSTIGVLSSKSEGLPLALIEYGMVGLPAISTRVGQCSEVLLDGEVGILVNPQEAKALADTIIDLLKSPTKREMMGNRFKTHIISAYSKEAVIEQICNVYESL